ncbi:helix-turn-helix transcriptional regulator [Rubrivirga marina]|uniref:HTH luxR-type domain-containing protein n=1 Tax=Rubrivirga marina TaxID=1196024 RepID=A0A271IYV1_9BACT|nr:helix-turn-helix transcriptional regulator [Rubrivirga marina]PAP75984.1 hypothetical protein BSZ37_05775 [Rubrivirga marina]
MFTSTDLSRLESASRTLLSPLAAPDVDAWRSEAIASASALLGADCGLFMLSSAPRVHVSDTTDAAFLAVYDQHVAEVTARGPRLSDAVMQRWLDERRRVGQEVVTNALADDLLAPYGLALRDSSLYNEGMAPGGWADQRTLYVGFGGGEAMLQLGYARADRAPDPDASVAFLRILLPSLKAGLDALGRLGAHRAALDAVGSPLALFDADARQVHRTAALSGLLAAEPDRDRLAIELRAFAATLRPLAAPRRHDIGLSPTGPVREVRTAGATYRLRGTILPADAAEAPLLVTVERVGAVALPSPEEVRQRTGLTLREAEVALLLAEGLTNVQVADRLFIAPKTARRHTENVLGKLEVATRAAVASALLRAA